MCGPEARKQNPADPTCVVLVGAQVDSAGHSTRSSATNQRCHEWIHLNEYKKPSTHKPNYFSYFQAV